MQPTGTLYVVATPIGNREDITLRALRTLGDVTIVAAEDTRTTRRLLTHHGIRKPLISYHEYNEDQRTPQLIQRMSDGDSVALVSNAGTPSVSDPGYRLIKASIAAGIPVIPIPGVSAAVTALSVSGLPTDRFLFVGFLSKKPGKRQAELGTLAAESRTIVFFESPKRIATLVQSLLSVFGDRKAVLSREMTKRHEEYLRGPLSEILADVNGRPAIKGECTLLVSGAADAESVPIHRIEPELRTVLETDGCALSETVKRVSKKYGIKKKTVYEMALNIKRAKDS